VNAETRQRVLDLAREMNYRPNLIARGLITGRSMLIGLVVPDISHSFFDEIFTAVQKAAQPRHYFVVLSHTNDDPKAELSAIHSLIERQVDGVILASAFTEKRASQLECLSQTPHVLIDRKFDTWSSSYVVVDDEKVGYLGTSHLARLGYQLIGHVAGPNVSTARLRLQGFRRAIREQNLPLPQGYIWRTGFHQSDGYGIADQILRQRPRPEAIFAANDPLAIGLIERFLELGIRVPEDIAVVGTGDVRYTSLLAVPLTTVRPPKADIGSKAVEILLDLVEDPQRLRQITLEPELVVRQSCGAGLRG
jgi:LacI family transcriptional regulator